MCQHISFEVEYVGVSAGDRKNVGSNIDEFGFERLGRLTRTTTMATNAKKAIIPGNRRKTQRVVYIVADYQQ